MPVEQIVPPEGITCVRCLEHSHSMKAIEYVQSEDGNKLEPLCCFHRDSDPCPGCVVRDKEAKEREADEAKRVPAYAKPLPAGKPVAIQKRVAQPVAGEDLKADAFTYHEDPNEEVRIPKPVKEILSKGKTMDPLEKVGVSIPEALKLLRGGMGAEELAKHFKVPVWRFNQSAMWKAAKNGVDQPAPPRKMGRGRPSKRASVQIAAVLVKPQFRATLLAVKADFEAQLAQLQQAMTSVDALLARYPE